MRNYPQPGERWQHERGWTVTIIRLIEASPSVALVNPEFSCEVLIRHDSDNQLSSCPLAWFKQRYTRLFDAPPFKPSPAPAGGSGSGPLTLHPSVVFTRWRERSIRRSAEPDDSHYSKFL
ncbi:hypothetical protein O7N56_003804 [Salmonella enterica]|uniref:Uncharacterized protein n=1 Tax=Salmonella enterica TaxID=28901 RepID=A0A747C6W3_SALER|nr:MULTISPECIES: hypothetical protein [Enterobacteriaceae]EAW5500056.1 hypothetical protein [Salmonella enterica subsp. enterica serovar Liverpool]EBV6447017.1 hypothetical protein [Salmonella enterica subsp. enterica serovar Havana]EDC2325065.1 hypothetical protein [Salmonella enterica]EDP8853087.1 hypothetical protein [Salmonella enterica subsp. enterica]ECA5381583.1 hypothetical protein [Salmonella enterica subsp. enterica serovar Isangi]